MEKRDWESIDRCKWLWVWAENFLGKSVKTVLDCGTKDAQFPAWLRDRGYLSVGVEISEPYCRYATELGRPVFMADVCNLSFADNQFDFVFSHHLLGLVPDNLIALREMYRVSKKYLLILSSISRNPKKHYSLMKDNSLFNRFINEVDCDIIYNDYLDTDEYVIFLEKKIDMVY